MDLSETAETWKVVKSLPEKKTKRKFHGNFGVNWSSIWFYELPRNLGSGVRSNENDWMKMIFKVGGIFASVEGWRRAQKWEFSLYWKIIKNKFSVFLTLTPTKVNFGSFFTRWWWFERESGRSSNVIETRTTLKMFIQKKSSASRYLRHNWQVQAVFICAPETWEINVLYTWIRQISIFWKIFWFDFSVYVRPDAGVAWPLGSSDMAGNRIY